MDKIHELLTRGVANIIPSVQELEKVLRLDKKLNVYLGIDPTSTKIHLGHAVPLRKLQLLAELGHNVTFLIGDFTALIGDTSDKDSERPVLTSAQIEQNFQTYKKQAEKIVDFSKVTVRHNSEWLQKLTFEDIVKLCQHYSVGDFISRELIRKRLDSGSRVALHEMLYPVMQGYDSYFMDTDIQLGGTDQTFNMQAGRTLQKDMRKKESFVLANVFLTGTDGRKMSKSWGNAVWLDDAPSEMYGKLMSIKDDLIVEYYLLGTNISLEEIEKMKNEIQGGANPMEIKKNLAFEIVKQLHSENDAQSAKGEFERVVQHKETPLEIQSFQLTGTSQPTIIDALVQSNLAESKSSARRLIEQGGAEFDNQVVTDPNFVIKTNGTIRAGKRKFAKIELT